MAWQNDKFFFRKKKSFLSEIRKLGSTREGGPKRPPLMKSGPEKVSPTKMASMLDNDALRRGELPSANGGASARGLARVAAAVACGGELDGVRIMNKETVDKMHEEPTKKRDFGLLGLTTDWTRGGVFVAKWVFKIPPMHRIHKHALLSFGGHIF